MKMYMIIAMCLLFVSMIGCSEVPEKPQYGRAVNSGLVKTYNDIAIQNAVISQHTLFPYHFVNNAMELNELGDSDLKVLAEHFAKHPGKLNIRRGNISEDLY